MSRFSFKAVMVLVLAVIVAGPEEAAAQSRGPAWPRGPVIVDSRDADDQDSDDEDSDDEDSDSDSDSDDRDRKRRDGRVTDRARSGDVCVDRNRDGFCDAGNRRRDTCIDVDRDGRCDRGARRRRLEDILGAVVRGGRDVPFAARRQR